MNLFSYPHQNPQSISFSSQPGISSFSPVEYVNFASYFSENVEIFHHQICLASNSGCWGKFRLMRETQIKLTLKIYHKSFRVLRCEFFDIVFTASHVQSALNWFSLRNWSTKLDSCSCFFNEFAIFYPEFTQLFKTWIKKLITKKLYYMPKIFPKWKSSLTSCARLQTIAMKNNAEISTPCQITFRTWISLLITQAKKF